MKLEIKSYDCADHDPIDEWIPDDIYEVNFSMNFTIGEIGTEGGSNFQAHIITHKALSQEKNKQGRFITLEEYSFEAVLNKINDLFKDKEFVSWLDANAYLNKYMRWEYDNYR